MNKNIRILFAALLAMTWSSSQAVKVTVKMNSRAYCMTMKSHATGQTVQFDSPSTEKTNGANTYVFNNIQPGNYTVTAYTYSGGTKYADMGTLQINVTDGATQTFEMGTLQIKTTNSGWTYGTDYTVNNLTVTDDQGNNLPATARTTPTQGYHFCVLYPKNATIGFQLQPSADRVSQGYSTYVYSKQQTGTNPNESVTIAIETFSITAPTAAHLVLSFKPSYDNHDVPSSGQTGMAHYVPFTEVQPVSTQTSGSNTIYTFRLQTDAYYAYRTWMDGKLTLAGRFTKKAEPSQMPQLVFTTTDYNAFAPTWISRDVTENNGYNVANILLNINPSGHLTMQVGEERNLMAQRDWQIVSNVTENFFLEPDYHFTVTDLNGVADNTVVQLSETDTHGSPWTNLKAVGKGTALVRVTYDAMQYDIYNGTTKTTPSGGNKWSALWPENTAVFVVTVGDEQNDIVPNMTVNTGKNNTNEKLSGDLVDAEHDVFYYLDDEEGFQYTFMPEGVTNVELAYPTIGTQSATYTGFSTTGVTHNNDGSYTLLLKHGRNIVRMTDAAGHAAYQVMTAKPCQRTISNITHPGEEVAHPGDKICVQYSGLYHPANKMAAVYNNSAYITYNGVEGGQSLYESANQYQFAAAPTAQLYGMQLSEEIDVSQTPLFQATDGCICLTGYGAPFGSHRNISKEQGLSASMDAIAHKSYMGVLPPFSIPLQEADFYTIVFEELPDGATVTLTKAGESSPRTPLSSLSYHVLPGIFNYTVEADGYISLTNAVNVIEGGDKTIHVAVHLVPVSDAWQGTTRQPQQVTASEANDTDSPYYGLSGWYKITDADEQAWIAAQVNSGNNALNAVLANDISLSGNNWTPIGNNSTKYSGNFYGNGHTISGLTIVSTALYQGLFGYTDGANIRDLCVEVNIRKTDDKSGVCYYGGIVGAATNTTLFGLRSTGNISVGSQEITLSGGSIANYNANVGGIAGSIIANTTVEQCANEASVMGAANVGGIAGNVNASTSTVKNCWNTGYISGVATAGGIIGNLNTTGIAIDNVYNYGENIQMRPYLSWGTYTTNNSCGAITGTENSTRHALITNAYASATFNKDSHATLLPAAAFTQGEAAYILHQQADCWGQQFGTNPLPDFTPFKVQQNQSNYCFGDYYSTFTPSGGQGASYTAYITTMVDKTAPALPADANTLFTANFTFLRHVPANSVASFVIPAELPTNAINGTVWQLTAVNGTKLQFAPVTTELLQPNTPYIVETADEGPLLPATLQNIALQPLNQLTANTLNETSIGRVTHFGTYEQKQYTTNATDTYYGYSNGKFMRANTATLQPFHTMFVVSGAAAAKPDELNLSLDGDNQTSILSPQSSTLNSQLSSPVYDLSGRRINTATTHTKQIQIINRKKVVTK
ncbi:MAG: hypothetical protein J5506_05795 [Prevotella sp.]|nr:hypothetical protein [Prevotella sp.]